MNQAEPVPVEIIYIGTHEKHHIEQNIVGPAENWPKVESILKEFGFSIQAKKSIPWRDAFPKKFTDNESGTAHNQTISNRRLFYADNFDVLRNNNSYVFT